MNVLDQLCAPYKYKLIVCSAGLIGFLFGTSLHASAPFTARKASSRRKGELVSSIGVL